ncbi:MAG: hypothetical protein Ct9H300mP23_07420 [Nitrospinota bacterium]|nr:MAG: hypothetical protein Ct9H300mP23_07420 [Nitrospinota bacterium]
MEAQDKFYQDKINMLANYLKLKNTILNTTRGLYIWKSSKQKRWVPSHFLACRIHICKVFAFDSKQGGFYEMEDVEVSRYVLGLSANSQKKGEKRI